MLSQPESSYLVITLWKCGDKVLNTKLSRCITRVELRLHRFVSPIHDSSAFFVRRAFPKMISSLAALRHFSVNTASVPLANLNSPRREILDLPSSLQTLKVSSSDAELFFVDFPAEINLYRPFEWERVLISTRYKRGSSRMINLGALFPNLSNLAVNLLSSNQNKSIFKHKDFAALPGHHHSSLLVCPQNHA